MSLGSVDYDGKVTQYTSGVIIREGIYFFWKLKRKHLPLTQGIVNPLICEPNEAITDIKDSIHLKRRRGGLELVRNSSPRIHALMS